MERQEGGRGEREHHGRQHPEEFVGRLDWQHSDQVRRFNLQSSISALLFFRYGETWTDWRQCGGYGGGGEEMLELDTGSNEEITEVSGYSGDSSGWTTSLASTTTAGRNWGPHGDHTPDSGASLRKSPSTALKLRFISGDQTADNYILR